MTEEIPEVVPDPVVPDEVPVVDDPPHDPPPHTEDERPSFVDEILTAIEGLPERLAPLPSDPAPDPLNVEDIPRDTSPVRKPWTHRNPFRKD